LCTQKQNWAAKLMHVPPPEHVPAHTGAVSQVTSDVLVVVDVDVVVVVVVDAPHASQQLVDASTVPSRAAQCPASRAIAQRGTPFRTRQQATAPGLPHVDFAAHRRTVPRHSGRSAFESTRVRATPAAHAT
jgi:hypothetical protein